MITKKILSTLYSLHKNIFKKGNTLILLFFCLSACNSSEIEVQTAVVETLTAIPTATVKPSPMPLPTAAKKKSAFDPKGYDFGVLQADVIDYFEKQYGYSFKNYNPGPNQFPSFRRTLPEDVHYEGTGDLGEKIFLSARPRNLVYAEYRIDLESVRYSKLSVAEFAKFILGDEIYSQIVYPYYYVIDNRTSDFLCFDNIIIWNCVSFEFDEATIMIMLKTDWKHDFSNICD